MIPLEVLEKHRNKGNRGKGILGKKTSLILNRYYKGIEKKHPELKGKYTDTEWRKMMAAFWDKVGEVLINQPNGVVLDGMGYFAFPSYMKKARHPVTGKTTFKNDGLIYQPEFFGEVFNKFYFLGMSLKLSRNLNRKWWKLVESGKNYVIHLNTIKKLVGARRKYAY